MRLVKLLLGAVVAAVAIVTGLVFAAVTAVGLALFFALRRLLRGSRAEPSARRHVSNEPEVIEVTATEIRSGNLEIEKR